MRGEMVAWRRTPNRTGRSRASIMTVYLGDNCIAQGHTGDGAAGFRQAPEGMPARTVKSEGSIVRHAVLLCEAAEGIKLVAWRRHTDMIGSAREFGKRLPCLRSDHRRDGRADRPVARHSRRPDGRALDTPLPRPSPCAGSAGALSLVPFSRADYPPLHVAGAGRGDRCGLTPRHHAALRPHVATLLKSINPRHAVLSAPYHHPSLPVCEFIGNAEKIGKFQRCTGAGYVANNAWILVAAIVDLGSFHNFDAWRNPGFDHRNIPDPNIPSVARLR